MTTATDELRKLLDERGIEWKDGDAAYEIEWSTPDGRHCSAMYWKPTFTVLISGCTPEQAIAATLGTEYHGYEQAAIEAWKSIKAWNTRATHGTLTAEQVRDVIERHSMWVNGNNRCFHNGAYEDIADELNADLGVGECEIVTTERWLPAERYHRCKICGAFFAVNACPNCGRW